MATILVVDDRPINRDFLVTLLGYFRHELLQAGDGLEALALAAARHPDLIITDVLMPVMDGVELARRLHADPALAGIPVIFYTATYRLDDAWALARSCGVDSVVGKPSSPRAILDAVAAKLGGPAHALPEPMLLAPGLRRLQAQLSDMHAQCSPADAAGDVAQQSLGAVTALSLRLAALLEVGLDLAAERDLDRLLDSFIRAASDIMNARCAAVGVFERDGRSARVAMRGLPESLRTPLAAAGADCAGILGRVLADGKVERLHGEASRAGELPAAHPAVGALLALPVQSPTRRYGWLYFADPLGGAAFVDQDEQIATVLASRLALACENLQLVDEAQRHAGESRRQSERIARLNRVLAVLSGINSAIVRIRERPALFDEACRIAVDDGHLALAWIGRVDGQQLTPLVWRARDGQGEAPQAIRLDQGEERSMTPGSGHVTVCDDLRQCRPEDAPGLDESARCRKLRSRAILSLCENGAVVGALVLYAAEAGFFDADEVRLLNELAGDLSFALDYIVREERLNYLACYDALTGLPNRGLFLDHVAQLVHGAARDGSTVALILLDIEHFKQINDRLGRHVGDALLKQVADRLSAVLRERNSVARVGANLYAIAVGALPARDGAMSVLRERVFATLAAVFPTADGEVLLSARAGLALFPGDGESAELLYAHAEVALAQAKTSGERYCYFDKELNARIAAKQALETDLRRALHEGQFVVHYQPKLNLQSGQIVGAEALIRWLHPQCGLIAPADFIPLAEECGQIVAIGEWVLRSVCAQQACWLAGRVDIVPVAVNLSAAQLRTGKVVDMVRDALAAARLDPRYLELELTESVVMHDPEAQVGTLNALRQLGVGLALDDFGTGYSSLAYLKRFPFTSVKIDRSFISELTRNPDDAAIADAAIGIARRLGMKTVAEGVETEGQMHYLRRLGCDEMQGYLFSRPVPVDDYQAMLRGGERLALPFEAQSDMRTLLLVDDEPHILAALRRLLRGEGYRVLTAGSGQEGLDLLAVKDVQVIISDQRMAGMSGAEFLSVAKELYPDTIRIILSGYTELAAVTDAVNRGAVFKFLTKPWDDELLRENVRDAFRRHRAPAMQPRS